MTEQNTATHGRLRDLLHQARAHLHAGKGGDEHQAKLQSAVGRAETALASRFDANHPQLAGSLRELADLLGKAGI